MVMLTAALAAVLAWCSSRSRVVSAAAPYCCDQDLALGQDDDLLELRKVAGGSASATMRSTTRPECSAAITSK